MLSNEIGNESEGGEISYKCPEDIGIPRIASSLQDWFGEVSRVLGRQFPPPLEIYGRLATTSAEYGVIGEM